MFTFIFTFLSRSAYRFRQKQVVLASILLLAVSSGTAQTISFPARASDLPDDSWWNMSGDHDGAKSRDMNVLRKTANGWSNLKGNTSESNSDHLIFDVPLYAPVDGEVVSCWANAPENPRPGVSHMGRCCGGDCNISCDDRDCPANNACTVPRSGNHVAIQKADGDVVLVAHLKSGSIAPSVCPNRGSLMTNARVRAGNYPAESFLRLCGPGETPGANGCVTSRPQLKRGEPIGRAGNSGGSSGPHLHIDTVVVQENGGILNKVGNVIETNLNFGWLKHRTDESVWKPFRADEIRNNPVIVNASPYLRRASATSADNVAATATLFLSSNRVVTATIRQPIGNLRLRSWNLVGTSALDFQADIDEGSLLARDIHLGEPATDYVLAAVRLEDDSLKMIAYHVMPGGTLLRRAEYLAGKISALDMATTTTGDRRSVTAVRDADGNLKLIAWDIQVAGNGTVSIVRLGQADAGAITAVAISRSRVFDGVFTAVRDGANELKVIPWKLSADGMSFTRGDSSSAGVIAADLDVAPLANGVAVAVRNSQGNLEIKTWSANANGDIGTFRGTNEAGEASEITLLTSPHGGSNLTSVVRGGDGQLYLIGWKIDSNGGNLRRLGSSRAGAASKISGDSVSRSYTDGPRDMIVTSMRMEGGDLRLISWDTNLVNP